MGKRGAAAVRRLRLGGGNNDLQQQRSEGRGAWALSKTLELLFPKSSNGWLSGCHRAALTHFLSVQAHGVVDEMWSTRMVADG